MIHILIKDMATGLPYLESEIKKWLIKGNKNCKAEFEVDLHKFPVTIVNVKIKNLCS
jgi:hypothetical protein